MMTHIAETDIAMPSRALVPPPPHRSPRARPRPHCSDPRWPAIATALAQLHEARRRSVRIVDADCGTGTLLLCAVRYARWLGFTAIEARGIDDAAVLVARARAAAAQLHDPAIGITFDTSDIAHALDEEADFPADIILWHGCAGCSDVAARAVTCAGHIRIAEPGIAA